MTAEQAIVKCREAHLRVGCVCPKQVISVMPTTGGNYSISIAHAWWCPFARSMEGPTP